MFNYVNQAFDIHLLKEISRYLIITFQYVVFFKVTFPTVADVVRFGLHQHIFMTTLPKKLDRFIIENILIYLFNRSNFLGTFAINSVDPRFALDQSLSSATSRRTRASSGSAATTSSAWSTRLSISTLPMPSCHISFQFMTHACTCVFEI